MVVSVASIGCVCNKYLDVLMQIVSFSVGNSDVCFLHVLVISEFLSGLCLGLYYVQCLLRSNVVARAAAS